ncbi:Ribulose-5-phosphate 4-epimerase/Fuculose-1-phosphate aldolase [Salipiger thiooxidans]|uniref:Ribulose-5-phosphate 4-epimerase/Fuculose-1-phosphate aldolase n=1 Tax=Salipiger thiooxidans TaxID=282683 RepID=A0A1G7K870_9RHOB|nr:class II aldolase/adducin family protein [Salipiger thiooxidans]SDF33337.1 Ribulose-5-phosphate 4-epimerase/Fuculose-1-phosphate aldolase [Salipiger thiooxidans]
MDAMTNVIDETQARIDLAAALRMTARAGMHEAVANHYSVALSADGSRFLINPKWMHWSRVRASDLVLVDLNEGIDPVNVDRTAMAIHGQVHKLCPAARVVMHLHPVTTTALASINPPGMPPIDQNSARYFNRLAVDLQYGGMANSDEEGARLAGLLGNKSRLLMGNHGVMITAETVGEAWDDIYTFDRSAQIVIAAMSTGRPLLTLSDEAAEQTAIDWEGIKDFSIAHFEEMKLVLDAECPDYRD